MQNVEKISLQASMVWMLVCVVTFLLIVCVSVRIMHDKPGYVFMSNVEVSKKLDYNVCTVS